MLKIKQILILNPKIKENRPLEKSKCKVVKNGYTEFRVCFSLLEKIHHSHTIFYNLKIVTITQL